MGKPGLYALAGIGAAQGAWRYYVRPELTANRAWGAMAAGILAYELMAPQGELLSEGVDRALERHRALTTIAVGATALHLLNVIPDRLDPFKVGLDLLR